MLHSTAAASDRAGVCVRYFFSRCDWPAPKACVLYFLDFVFCVFFYSVFSPSFVSREQALLLDIVIEEGGGGGEGGTLFARL